MLTWLDESNCISFNSKYNQIKKWNGITDKTQESISNSKDHMAHPCNTTLKNSKLLGSIKQSKANVHLLCTTWKWSSRLWNNLTQEWSNFANFFDRHIKLPNYLTSNKNQTILQIYCNIHIKPPSHATSHENRAILQICSKLFSKQAKTLTRNRTYYLRKEAFEFQKRNTVQKLKFSNLIMQHSLLIIHQISVIRNTY